MPKVKDVKKNEKLEEVDPLLDSEVPIQKETTKADIEKIVAQKTFATVYVEGIPYSADESDLVSHFSSCGVVKNIRLPRYQDSGKIRGYCHVEFEEQDAANAALKLDGEYLKGRYLHIKPAEAPRLIESISHPVKKVKGCKTVFVKNLPYDISEEQLQQVFSSCGEIVSVRLATWNQSKRLKGFGYVEFSEETSAEIACKKSGMRIGDRMVVINYDDGAPKASFRLPTGQYFSNVKKTKENKTEKEKHNKRRYSPYSQN